jgi:hypothetical protein
MGTATPQQTAQTEQAGAAEPRAATPITPTPQPNELAGFLAMQAAGTLPHIWTLKQDGSPIDPKSFDPVPKTPTWP